MSEVSWLAISIFYGIYVAGLGTTAFMIKDERLRFSKALFFLLFIVSVFLSSMFLYSVTLNPEAPENIAEVGLGFFSVNMLAMILFIYTYAAHLITKVFKKKGDKHE